MTSGSVGGSGSGGGIGTCVVNRCLGGWCVVLVRCWLTGEAVTAP